jgi:hypothetical protein
LAVGFLCFLLLGQPWSNGLRSSSFSLGRVIGPCHWASHSHKTQNWLRHRHRLQAGEAGPEARKSKAPALPAVCPLATACVRHEVYVRASCATTRRTCVHLILWLLLLVIFIVTACTCTMRCIGGELHAMAEVFGGARIWRSTICVQLASTASPNFTDLRPPNRTPCTGNPPSRCLYQTPAAMSGRAEHP